MTEKIPYTPHTPSNSEDGGPQLLRPDAGCSGLEVAGLVFGADVLDCRRGLILALGSEPDAA